MIVGAAIIADGRVLACARSAPPEVAGRWEFPGGKVEPGESETAALVRECAEELAVRVEVGDRVGRDVRMAHGRSVLKVYAARLLGGQPRRWSTPSCAGSPPTTGDRRLAAADGRSSPPCAAPALHRPTAPIVAATGWPRL